MSQLSDLTKDNTMFLLINLLSTFFQLNQIVIWGVDKIESKAKLIAVRQGLSVYDHYHQ